MNNNAITRFLGTSPLAALAELVLVSILVGVILAAIGFDPWHIWRSLHHFFQAVWALGLDPVVRLWRYFILVIPLWLIIRLLKRPCELLIADAMFRELFDWPRTCVLSLDTVVTDRPQHRVFLANALGRERRPGAGRGGKSSAGTWPRMQIIFSTGSERGWTENDGIDSAGIRCQGSAVPA